MLEPTTAGKMLLLALVLAAAFPAVAGASPDAGPAVSYEQLQQENATLRQQVVELERKIEKLPVFWMAIGFVGQFIFGMRFVVQWIASERKKQSVVPVAFWYLSLGGTVVTLVYAIYRKDPVFIAAFCLNMVIYLRNLYFIHGKPAPAMAEGGR